MGELTLAQSQEFSDAAAFSALPGETLFAYCHFEDFEISRPSVEGAFLGCKFSRVAFYWELFNTALVSRTEFEDCVFSGCSFRGVDFLSATFTRCRFGLDNLGGGCLFEDCRFVDCAFENCEFVADPRPGRKLFGRNRFFDCRQRGTRGARPPFG